MRLKIVKEKLLTEHSLKMTKKDVQLRLDQIDDQICKLMEEAEQIKNMSESGDAFDKQEFENLLNTYENSSSIVKNMFLSYVIDTHYDKYGLFL